VADPGDAELGWPNLDAWLDDVQGTISVWVGPLVGQAWYARHADETHNAASTMKVPLLLAVLRQVDSGMLDLDTAVPVLNAFRSAADGTDFEMDRSYDSDDEPWNRLGGHATLGWLGTRAIVASSNLATNLLLDLVGIEAVNSAYAACGVVTSFVSRGIEDAAASAAGRNNVVTAAGLADVFRAIGNGTAASTASCERIEGILSHQQHRDGIPAGLPTGTYVANKPGWVDGVTHDAALVRPSSGRPFALVVCTTAPLAEPDAWGLIASISAGVWARRPLA
jgi:beta-lactamase class A